MFLAELLWTLFVFKINYLEIGGGGIIDNSLHDLLQLQVDELFIKDKKGNEK